MLRSFADASKRGAKDRRLQMKTLVMVPAMGCDNGLYVELARGLEDIVSLQTIIADGDRLETCVEAGARRRRRRNS